MKLFNFMKYEGKTAKQWKAEADKFDRWLSDYITERQTLIEKHDKAVAALEKELCDLRSQFMTYQRDALLVKQLNDDVE